MNWHTAYVDGEPSRFRTTDEGAANLPDGQMTRLQFGEWASRWPCDGMFAAGCLREYRRHEAERRRLEYGCCSDGPDEHGVCKYRLDCSVLRITRRLMGLTGVRK